MAALLVALGVMSVLMSAVLPAWRHQAQREKEEELIFRGEQYVRAIRLWEMRNGPGSRPPTFDALVQQKFLRKKYKDPMTKDGEFQPLFIGANMPVPVAGRGGRGGRGAPAVPGAPGAAPPQQSQLPQNPIGGQFGGGGIQGVVSKSRETSIRIYKGGSHYNEWNFVYAGASSMPGGGVGTPMPGGRGGSPVPGGRGRGGRGLEPGGRGPGGRGFGPGGQGPGMTPPGGRGGRM